MSSIGDIIKKARLEKGLSMQELADCVGVSKSAISRYESGSIGNMGIDKARAMAKALGLDPLVFIYGDQLEKENEPLSENEIQVISYYRSSNQDGRMKIKSYSKDISILYPYVPNRVEMVQFLSEFDLAAFGGSKAPSSMSDDELSYFYSLAKRVVENE